MKVIPDAFIKHLIDEGIPSKYAQEIFYLKQNKKGLDQIVTPEMLKEIGNNSEYNVKKAINKAWADYKKETVVPVSSDFTAGIAVDKETFLEKARSEFEKLIGKLGKAKYDVANKKQDNRAIVISDLHVPFHSKEALLKVAEDPASKLFIAGDFFDMYAVSKYRHNISALTVQEELAVARQVLEFLATKFKEIYVIPSGNHDARARKLLQGQHPQLVPLLLHPFDIIRTGLENVHVLKSSIPNTAPHITIADDIEIDYFGMHGDAFFSHLENFCGEHASKKVYHWINQWDHVLKLERKPRVIFHGHTHRLGLAFTPKGELLVDTGCMCNPMEYQFDNHGRTQPPTLGYVVFFQDKDGNTDLNNTQIIHLGVK